MSENTKQLVICDSKYFPHKSISGGNRDHYQTRGCVNPIPSSAPQGGQAQSSIVEQVLAFCDAAAAEQPLAKRINSLPEWARKYIHDVETKCDPAGDIRTIAELRDTIRALEIKCAKPESQPDGLCHVEGCGKIADGHAHQFTAEQTESGHGVKVTYLPKEPSVLGGDERARKLANDILMIIGCPQNSPEEFHIGKHMALTRMGEVIEKSETWQAAKTKLKRFESLEEHLPPGFAIGDDATAELAVEIASLCSQVEELKQELQRKIEESNSWRRTCEKLQAELAQLKASLSESGTDFKYYKTPFEFREPVSENGAPYIYAADGGPIAMIMWPTHPPEETEAAEQEAYRLGRIMAATVRPSADRVYQDYDHAQICKFFDVSENRPLPSWTPYAVQRTVVEVLVNGKRKIIYGGAAECGNCGYGLSFQPEGDCCPKCGVKTLIERHVPAGEPKL